MKLMEDYPGKKGITLNLQLVELLSILDEQISEQEKDERIQKYIDNLRKSDESISEIEKQGTMARYSFVVNEAISSLGNLSSEQQELLKNIIMQSIPDLSVCDKSVMQQRIESAGIDKKAYEELIKYMGEHNYKAKEGILTLTPEKVKKLYAHMFEGGNRYDRVTFDNVGKYSGYVGVDGETYTTYGMDKMVDFCEKHGMEAKVNTLMFYADFPELLEASLDNKVKQGLISEDEKKSKIKQVYMDYATHLAERYAGRIQCVDIFNELVYDDSMLEKRESFEEEPTYHYRTKGWQKYLGIEDLCQMALRVRSILPDVTFTYNEMHWVEPGKRKAIIETIKKIKDIEEQYRQEGLLLPGDRGLIDTIGIEAHLFTEDSLDELENAFDDIRDKTGLPIEVTELDVSRTGQNPNSLSEITKQKLILQKIKEMSKRPDVVGLTIWSQSDELCFVNDRCGRKVYGSLLDADFEEKDIGDVKEIIPQKFNYHTHTKLCGHADGEIEEYIQKAIEGGYSTLGFSDHSPNPVGQNDSHHAMNMEEFEEEYIPKILELKEKYKGKIGLKVGLEEEYYGDEGEQMPAIIHYRERTTKHLDYLILGQHFALAREDDGRLKQPIQKADPASGHYPLDYAMTVVEAIKSGKYALVAHPDIFLSRREHILPEERKEYDENVKKACEMICDASNEYGIPLEVNLGAMSAIKSGKKQLLRDGTYPYPVPYFWKVAQEKGCQVLIGIDAHTPDLLKDRSLEIEAKKYLKEHGIDFDYLDSFEPKGIGKEGKRIISLEELKEGIQGELIDSQEVDGALADMTKQISEAEHTKEEKQGVTHG